MTKWYQNVSTSEKKTFLACFCSWGLDTFENQMFIFLVPTLITYFAITSSQIAIFTSCTLVTTALGGWFAGALSDRYGRIKTLQIMVAWFSILTFILAFVNKYQTLLVLRTLQGFAIGGDWAAGAVLMA